MSKTATYSLIESQTLGSATTTITFTSIPGTFTDLILIASGTCNAGSYFTLRFNSDTSTNYSNTEIYHSGASALSARNANGTYMYNGSFGTAQTITINQIQDYSNSTTNKTVLTRSAIGGSETKVSVGLWRSTSAITSITCGTGGANTFQTGSTFKLYGIQAGNA